VHIGGAQIVIGVMAAVVIVATVCVMVMCVVFVAQEPGGQ